MTREELTARLAECEGHTPEGWINDLGDIRESADGPVIATVWNRKDQERTNKDTALVRLAPALASALREAWAEIDRLKAHLSNPLDEALSSGDGSYKP